MRQTRRRTVPAWAPRWRAGLLALVLCAGLTGNALAYEYYDPTPSGTSNLMEPTISQQFVLGAGEHILQVQMWLDGNLVPAQASDSTGLVSYTPTVPLAPGVHHVKLSVQVTSPDPSYYYQPQSSSFDFTVSDGALKLLPTPDPEALRALNYVNSLRKMAGLAPMTYNANLGAAAAGHARYITVNDAPGHTETPGNPDFVGEMPWDRTASFGYSGGTDEVVDFVRTAEDAIDDWMATIYHRTGFMSGASTEMGYGQAGTTEDDRANVIDMGPLRDVGGVAIWPVDGQTMVPTGWAGREEPDPFRLYPGTQGPVGYSVTMTWGHQPKSLTLTTATITDPNGATVATMRFSPQNDDKLTDSVGLIPYQPLRPGTTYRVRMAGQVDLGTGATGYDRTWQFTTDPEPTPLIDQVLYSTDTATGLTHGILVGQGFTPGSRVFWGNLPAQNVQVLGGTKVTFDTPRGYKGGAGDLLLVTPAGKEALAGQLTSGPDNAHPAFTAVGLSLQWGGATMNVSGLATADGTLLVPQSAFTRAGATGTLIPDLNRTYWSWQGAAADVTAGSTRATVNGKPLQLSVPVQVVNGQTYIPLAFAAKLAGATASRIDPNLGLWDLGSNWARDSILQLVTAGVVRGYVDGSFRPQQTLSRAEFVAMLVKARHLTLEPGKSGGFSDTATNWVTAQGYLGAAVDAGIVTLSDYPGGQFQPDRAISRSEIARMVDRALGLDATARSTTVLISSGRTTIQDKTFTDAATWPQPGYVAVAVKAGILTGYANSGGTYTFQPSGLATRAEAVTVTLRLMDKLSGL